MSAGTRNQSLAEGVPLGNAMFCLDCEVISRSRSDECPACKSRSVVSLARMLGGSLNKVDDFRDWESVLFDVSITVELQHMHATELNTTLENLTALIGPRLPRGQASLRVDVKQRVRNAFKRAA